MAVPYLHHSPDTHAIQHDTSINFEYIEVKKAVHIINAKRSSPFALLGLHTKWPKVKRWRVHETRVIDTNTHKNSTANKKTIFLKKLILKSFFFFFFFILSFVKQLWIVMQCGCRCTEKKNCFMLVAQYVVSKLIYFSYLILLSALSLSNEHGWVDGKRIHWKHLFK